MTNLGHTSCLVLCLSLGLGGCAHFYKATGLKTRGMVKESRKCITIDDYVLCEGMTYEELKDFDQWITDVTGVQ